jgi:hypothetical protein
LISVKARSSENLSVGFESKAEPSYKPVMSMTMTSVKHSKDSLSDVSTRAATSPGRAAPAWSKDPEAASRLRKLSGLSTAFTLYSHYFYPWMRAHAVLVDAAAMEKMWPVQPALRNDPHSQPVSYDGFIPDGSPCTEPALWLLGAVVAALAAVLERVQPAEDGQEDDAASGVAGNRAVRADCGSRSSPTLPLIAQVFDIAASSQWMKKGESYSLKCFAARLRADVGFWEAFARERGLGAAAADRAAQLEGEGDMATAPDDSRQGDLSRLLVWLIGARSSPATEDLTDDITIRSSCATRLVDVLMHLGLAISCNSRAQSGPKDQHSGDAWLVSVRPAPHIAAQPPTDTESDSGDAINRPTLGRASLATVQEEEEESDTDASDTSESEAETDGTSIDDEAMSFSGVAVRASQPEAKSAAPVLPKRSVERLRRPPFSEQRSQVPQPLLPKGNEDGLAPSKS